MNNIKWEDGAVCYATNEQRYANDDAEYIISNKAETVSFNSSRAISSHDFQLNEIRTGDCIEALELDTEQKYNDAVEVFKLFGFARYEGAKFGEYASPVIVVDGDGDFIGCEHGDEDCKRKITHPQLMAIGKLKRAMLERDSNKQVEQLSMRSIEPRKQPKTSIDYLNECMEVQKERGEQYNSKGTGERSFAAIAEAFTAITGKKLVGSDIALIQQILKDVRQYADPTRFHEDSGLDKVSYASLHAEELRKELL